MGYGLRKGVVVDNVNALLRWSSATCIPVFGSIRSYSAPCMCSRGHASPLRQVTAIWRRKFFGSPGVCDAADGSSDFDYYQLRSGCRHQACITLIPVFSGHASPSTGMAQNEYRAFYFPLRIRNGSSLSLYCRWSGGVRASAA